MLEYKVRVDTSMKGDNKPEALEKTINAMVADGWRLAHVSSFFGLGASHVYCFFEREK